MVIPFLVLCDSCHFFNMKLPNHCENSNSENYGPEGGLLKGKSGHMFDYTDLYGEYNCGLSRICTFSLWRFLPEYYSWINNRQSDIILTDTFPTGLTAIDWEELKGGENSSYFWFWSRWYYGNEKGLASRRQNDYCNWLLYSIA